MPSPDDPGPRRDPWWILVLGLLILIFLLWALLERTNTPEPGGVREGRGGGRLQERLRGPAGHLENGSGIDTEGQHHRHRYREG